MTMVGALMKFTTENIILPYGVSLLLVLESIFLKKTCVRVNTLSCSSHNVDVELNAIRICCSIRAPVCSNTLK